MAEARQTGRVLVVDDDPAVGKVLAGLLSQAGHTASHVESGDEAVARVASQPVDVVITDLRMPTMDGMTLLEELLARVPELPVVMLTAHGTVKTAVEAMKKGAADFLLKPFDRDAVLFTVDKVLKASRYAAERPLDRPPTDSPWLGESAVMKEVTALVEKAAQSSATVLIRGESGSGKEVVARAIHEHGARSDGPFIAVHCAALPESLLESELFGYEKGAFTGATHRKPGRVELAHGGTLFLDEIGDVSPAIQVKLLRVLQEKEYERLGGTESIRADVRFVAATHRDLDSMVEEGDFREDLFYRLDVIPLWVPPLRERADDIPPLVQRFMRALGPENGRPDAWIDPDAVALLREQSWPGNVRELANFVERLVVFAQGDRIARTDVLRELKRRPPRRGSTSAVSPPETLDQHRHDAERAAISEALEQTRGNRTQAARILGISRRTLYNKLAEMDDRPSEVD